MRITGSAVQLQAGWARAESRHVEESIRIRRQPPARPQPAPGASATAPGRCRCDDEQGPPGLDHKLAVIIGLIERLTGIKVHVMDGDELSDASAGDAAQDMAQA